MTRRSCPALTRRALLGIGVTALLAGCGTPSSESATTDWPMFGYDPARTGVHPTTNAPTTAVEVVWQQQTNGEFLASPVVANGRIFVGGRDGTVHAFEAVDGTRQWTFHGGGSAFNAPAAVHDGVVYIGNADHRLYALAADGGLALWGFNFGLTEWWTEFPASVVSAPAIDRGQCYLQTTDGIGYAVDLTSGTAQWRAGIEGKLFTSPAVADNTLYLQGIGGQSMTLSAIDTRTGDRQWQINHGTDRPPTRSTPAIRDGRVVFGSNDGRLYAVSTEGTVRWDYASDGFVASSPSLGDEHVYATDTAGTVFALDPADGRRQWQTNFDIASSVVPSAPAVADGTVVIGVGDTLRALDTATGDQRWRFQTDGPITGTPVILNGRVYAQSTDGVLYCLQSTG